MLAQNATILLTLFRTRGVELAVVPVLASTQYGPVAGVVAGGKTAVFQGIPFAAPPVGSLRWKAPVSAQQNTRV